MIKHDEWIRQVKVGDKVIVDRMSTRSHKILDIVQGGVLPNALYFYLEGRGWHPDCMLLPVPGEGYTASPSDQPSWNTKDR